MSGRELHHGTPYRYYVYLCRCEECTEGKRVAERDAKRKKVLSSLGPYQCSFCGGRFYTAEALKSHKEKRH